MLCKYNMNYNTKYCIRYGPCTNAVELDWLYTSWLTELLKLFEPSNNDFEMLNKVLNNSALTNNIITHLFDSNKPLKTNIQNIIISHNYPMADNDQDNIQTIARIYEKELFI